MTPGIKIVVAVFVSLIIGAIIGFVIGQSSVPNTVVTNNGGGQTNDQYQTLEQQYQTLQQQYQTSEQQLNYYRDQYQTLEQQYQTLQQQYQTSEQQLNYYRDQYQTLEQQYQTLQQQYQTSEQQLNYYRDQYQTLEQQYQTLQQQYQTSEQQLNYYKQVLSLSYSDTLISNQVVNQPAGYFSYWCYTANYTGYIVVNVQSSTTTQTYARVYWNAYGINYDNSISVGSQGTAVFPVLPSNYCVGVGNNNLINGATETITITYYY
ncbi:hypothetical protein [Sulfolobus acidocaldarius]|uniref:hypothetical protein n=1 Tax=Sulfolobus acidocaldarius TaxID=2285 RepID=UPI00068B19DE|nr:hypothetical protein [Sulfolobus acidocaldarius]